MDITQLNTARYHGLNLTDLQILLLLAEQGSICMSDLAADLGITEAAVSLACRKLVGKMLIQRVRSRWTDGRLVMVELADLGGVRIHQITGKFPERVFA
jgi:DNA-binding MarR family transcriptional regulator